MSKKLSFTLLAAIAGAGLTAAPAQADPVYAGGPVTFQYYAYGSAYNGLGSPTTCGAPCTATFGDYFNVSASGNQITYTYLGNTTWSASGASLNSDGLYVDNGAVLYSGAGIPAITSVLLDPLSNLGLSGFSSSNVTFNSGAVAVSWAGLTFDQGDTIILDVNGTGAVPEPATWAMMLLGFGAIGLVLRGKRKSALHSIA